MEGLSTQQIIDLLSTPDYNQSHLFTDASDQVKEQLVSQIRHYDRTYPGGLIAYFNNARRLLADSANNVNPFEGWQPQVPEGETVSLESNPEQFFELESIGLEEVKNCAFVLVAGGLGERLGYSGIKVEIPIELVTNTTFLQYYIDNILAIQSRVGGKLPLAIMTSEDTHQRTVDFLERNNNFGMPSDQITVMKQEMVPALIDNDARMAVNNGKLIGKPHGHGDVHTLLYQHNLPQLWQQQGVKWILFFQDTNALIFKVLLPFLGVSKRNSFEMNFMAIARQPNEAVGGIMKLVKGEETMTLNVEYNQIDALLKESGWHANGDVPNSVLNLGTPETAAFSPFPGNTNTLLYSLDEYLVTLTRTQGGVPEFVNPKYADETKTVFKAPTRLECMMQDYPKLLGQGAKVGFTVFDRWISFSAVKNSLTEARAKQNAGLPTQSAGAGESDFYYCNMRILQLLGYSVESPVDFEAFSGLNYQFPPKIIIHPSFAISLQELRNKLKGNISISCSSSLVLKGKDTVVDGLLLDGELEVTESLQNGEHQNQSYITYVPVQETDPEYLQIRGFKRR